MKNLTRTLPGTLAIALTLGFTLVTPAGAVTRDGTDQSHTAPSAELADAKPAEERPVRVLPDADPDRPHRDIERLTMNCGVADGDTVTDRISVGCQWRAVQNERAVGYQVWRIVDRGERELVARVGLDSQATRDVVPAGAKVVRYAVLALDADGVIVGRSSVQRVVVGEGGEVDRPADVEAQLVRPINTDGAAIVRWPLAVR